MINEILIRFKDRDLRFRYTQQVLAQWTVFSSFQIMLSFATRHGAGVPQVNFKYIFTPIHLVFLTLLVLGFSPKYGAYCYPNPYPKIFFVQTAFFFSLYLGFRFMKKFNYFVAWRSYDQETGQDDNYNKQIEKQFLEEEMTTVNGDTLETTSRIEGRRKQLEIRQLKAQMVFIA